MSFEVKTTPHFEREAKILAKRYKSFKADMKDFIESLEKNPMQGDELSPGIRKIRLAIVSKGKGGLGEHVLSHTRFVHRRVKVVFILWMSMISQTSLP